MRTICRIYEQTDRGMKKIAEIRGSKVTGKKAAYISRIFKSYGFPHLPIEDVIDLFLMTHPGMGASVIGPMDDD